MKTRVLIVDGSIDPSIYRPVEQWARHLDGVAFDAVRPPVDDTLPNLDDYTHVLLTGSEASLEEPQPWFGVEADIVRDAADRGLPILGSCFGHQLLVWALSGPAYVRQAARPELGWVAVDILRQDLLLAGLPNPWHAFASHLDEVVDLPDPWRILAANEDCSAHVIRYGEQPIWGVQLHPETNPAEGMLLMRAAIDRFPVYADRIRSAMRGPVRDDGVAGRLIESFLGSA